jgi:putative protease
MSGAQIGTITHYFDHISVAVLSLTGKIRVKDVIHILGHSSDVKQEVTSLQIEHKEVQEAGPGDDVAMKVTQRVPFDQFSCQDGLIGLEDHPRRITVLRSLKTGIVSDLMRGGMFVRQASSVRRTTMQAKQSHHRPDHRRAPLL